MERQIELNNMLYMFMRSACKMYSEMIGLRRSLDNDVMSEAPQDFKEMIQDNYNEAKTLCEFYINALSKRLEVNKDDIREVIENRYTLPPSAFCVAA